MSRVVRFPKKALSATSAARDEDPDTATFSATVSSPEEATNSTQLQVRIPADTTNEQAAEQLALRIWAAWVGKNAARALSDLLDTLMDAHLLDDDDEEADSSWLDDQQVGEQADIGGDR
jgi:hypothetical protein